MAKPLDTIELEIRQQITYLTERARHLHEEQLRIESQLIPLEKAAQILSGVAVPALDIGKPAHEAAASVRRERKKAKAKQAAPYGYKADGTPYKVRPGAGRPRSVAARTREAGSATLRVTSSLHPTEAELAGRELVHATEQPA